MQQPKPSEHFRFIGTPLPRKEDARLTTGAGRFSDDFSVPGQCYLAVVRSPHPHARIRNVDFSAARALPGVVATFSGADCLAAGLNPIPHDPLPKTKFDMKLHAPGGGAVFIGPHLLLPADKARHVGEAVAAVVAETQAQALDAAEAVVVDYEELPFVLHSEDAMKPEAPLVWAEAPLNTPVDTWFGDPAATDAAFASADHVVAMDFHIDRVTGVPLEPRAALAEFDAASGRYTLHAGSGGAVRQKNELSGVLGIAPERLRVLSYDVGGNFGTRNRVFVEFGLVLWAAGQLRRPVKYTASRSECFLSDYQGRDLVTKVELALRRDGKFLGDARHQYQQCGGALRVAVAALQGRRADHRLLRHSGRDAACHGGLHQHHADPGLPQFRPARGDVCDRALGGHRRGTARLRPHRAAAQEFGAAKTNALPQRGRHALRQRPLRREHEHGDGRSPTGKAFRRGGAKPSAAAGSPDWGCRTTWSPPSAHPRSRRKSGCGRKGGSTW